MLDAIIFTMETKQKDGLDSLDIAIALGGIVGGILYALFDINPFGVIFAFALLSIDATFKTIRFVLIAVKEVIFLPFSLLKRVFQTLSTLKKTQKKQDLEGYDSIKL